MPKTDNRHIRNILFATTLLAMSAGAQENDTSELNDQGEGVVEESAIKDVVIEEGILNDDGLDDAPIPGPLDQVVPVADEEVAVATDDVNEEVIELSDMDLLLVEFERYKELMGNGVYDEADTVAKRVVEMAARMTGAASLETARALTNLAIVQHRNQQYVPSQQNFLASIEIIEEADNRLSPYLVNPLRGLGAAQLEGGRPDLASATFTRAVHITHVNEGPHNLYQLELLQSLAEVQLRLGEADEARDLQDRMYQLNVRQYSSDTMALIPPLIERANWQHRAGLIIEERSTYRRVIQIIEKNEGKKSLTLVSPLLAYGRSFFYVDRSGMSEMQHPGVSSGEMFFKRALRIVEDDPATDWKLRATTKLAVGDYYMYIGSENRARRVYVDTWEMLSIDEEMLEFRRNMLERAVLLDERPLPQYVSNKAESDSSAGPDELLAASLTVNFDINDNGRVSSLKFIQAEPADFVQMQRAVQRNLRSRAYRPRFEDGLPVATPNQILIHDYYYRQEDLDEIRSAADQT
jgi:tetratricopeptide (TPR) repeat protein